MQVCTNCGEKRKGKEKFCVGCGKAFIDNESNSKPIPAKSERVKQKLSSKQKTRRLTGIIALSVIVLGLIGGHLYMKSMYDATRTLKAMNQAFSAGDETKFIGQFKIEDTVIKDDEGFYAFMEEEGWETVRTSMKTEAERLSTEGLSNIILDSQGNKLISVLEEPKVWGLYNQVSFMVHPIKLLVEMPIDNTKFSIGDSESSGNKGDQVSFGEFLPGVYEWEANIESEISAIKENGKLNTYDASKNKVIYEPSFEVGIVQVTSDLPDAILWINGESTKKTIKEMNSIGPVKMDGSVEITAEGKDENGETVKGEPISIEDDSIHIAFAHVQEKVAAEREEKFEQRKLQQTAEEHADNVAYFIEDFRYSFETALNYADFSYIVDYFPTGSQIQKDYLADMDRHTDMENYYYYDFQSNTITDFEVIDENTFEVTTAEMFYFDSESDRLRYNKTKVYTVILLQDRYYIQEIKQLTTDKESV